MTFPSLLMNVSKLLRHVEVDVVIVCVADTTSFSTLSALPDVSFTVTQAFFRDVSTSPTKVVTWEYNIIMFVRYENIKI